MNAEGSIERQDNDAVIGAAAAIRSKHDGGTKH